MELENILKNCKKSNDKYGCLVKNIELYIYNKKQEQVKEIIDSVVDIDRNALSKRIEIWNAQKFNVRSNEEYDFIEIRIKIAESILNAL